MCGITACVRLRRGGTSAGSFADGKANNDTAEELEAQLRASIKRLRHRGPDAAGVWISADGAVGLGHARLSINGLGPDGDQPLHSDGGRGPVHAVVNGEIYDHDALRERLAREHGCVFRGGSDSEVLVALYVVHGAPAFLEHARGEFAFVIFDERDGRVVAGRDRFGIKPLFWTVLDGGRGAPGEEEPEQRPRRERLLFASEAKGLLPFGWRPEWDVAAIFSTAAVLGDGSLFKGVKKILPGYWMEVTPDGEIKHHSYWEISYKDKREVETRSVEEMILGVRERLIEAVRLRLRADVPVGIYLSGGIDSSAIAGIATHLAREEGVRLGSKDPSERISCFSIQFPPGSGFDESDIAERTASWLGVQIQKISMDEAALAAGFADTTYHVEHHHWDLNGVGKWALSTLPRAGGVPVVLTGEGSDEHFAGYPFHMPDFFREPDLSMPHHPLTQRPALREGVLASVQEALRVTMAERGFPIAGFSLPITRDAQRNTHRDGPESPHRQNGNSANGLRPEQQQQQREAENGGGSSTGQFQSAIAKAMTYSGPLTTLYARWVLRRWGSPAEASLRATLESMPAGARAMMRGSPDGGGWHSLHSALYRFVKGGLANTLLTCLGDRSEMAHSIEARPPFLDHVLCEYVNGLPPSVKVSFAPRSKGRGTAIFDSNSSSLVSPPTTTTTTTNGTDPSQPPPRQSRASWWTAIDSGNRRADDDWDLSEKWILREACRPFITDELYARRKHPYTAPVRWPRGGPMHAMLRGLLTEDAVARLGFVSWPAVERALETAFGDDDGDDVDQRAFRMLQAVGGWVVLSQRFGVRTARAEDWAASGGCGDVARGL